MILVSDQRLSGGRPIRTCLPRDLTVGDLVLGWSHRVERPPDPRQIEADELAPYRVTEVTPDMIEAVDCHARRTRLTTPDVPLWMVVVGPAPVSEGFPHACPMCGAPAYVGLMRVEHASPTDCPAT